MRLRTAAAGPLLLLAGAVLRAGALQGRIVYDLQAQGEGEDRGLESQGEGRSYSLDSWDQGAPDDPPVQGEGDAPAENRSEGEWTTTVYEPAAYEPDLYDGPPRRPGCYMRMLSGCPKSPLRSEAWRHDSWAEEHGLDEAGCKRRKHTWDKHCGSQDAELLYVGGKTGATWNLGVPPADPAVHPDPPPAAPLQAEEGDGPPATPQEAEDGTGPLAAPQEAEKPVNDAESDEAANLDQPHDDAEGTGPLAAPQEAEKPANEAESDEAANLDQAQADAEGTGPPAAPQEAEKPANEVESDEAADLDQAQADAERTGPPAAPQEADKPVNDAESDEAANFEWNGPPAAPQGAEEFFKLAQDHADANLRSLEQAHVDAESDEAAEQAHNDAVSDETADFEQADGDADSDEAISDEAFNHKKARNDAALLEVDLATYPTEPGCYMRMPSGCPNKPMRTMTWRHDAWAEENNLSEESCKNRKNTWNTYCGATDARIAFVPKQ